MSRSILGFAASNAGHGRARAGLRRAGRVLLGGAMVAATLVAAPGQASADPSGSVTFSYSGAAQTWTVPAGVTSVAVDLSGAQGGDGSYGGLGARVRATLAVTPGETLGVNVGGAGGLNTAGWNGGGGASGGGYGGGGASDIRKNGTGTAQRVAVAAGGGGAAEAATSVSGIGGTAGAPNGTAGTGGASGQGGTQTAGGPRGCGNVCGVVGGLAAGGNGGGSDWAGGGGGGGYYGGGGGGGCYNGTGVCAAGGGGGSSWVTAAGSSVRMDQGVRRDHGTVKISWPPAPTAPVTPPAGSATFSFTGAPQWLAVPDGVQAVAVDIFGAQGGDDSYGGLAARARATLVVSPGDTLQVNVGGAGGLNTGGWNGGGAVNGGAFGGGGASDIRKNGIGLTERVIVAGGGGGAAEAALPNRGVGGAGGAPNGTAGTGSASGSGATQTAGGPRGCANQCGVVGAFAIGGKGGGSDWAGGSGGGGYYGGGGAGWCYNGTGVCAAGGGGGSSWVTATGAGVRMDQGARRGAGTVTISWPPAVPTPVAATPGTASFSSTGAPQWLTIPDGVHAVAVDLSGAQGGDDATSGGQGGQLQATLAVAPGDVLQVNVGGAGGLNTGGWNGGGSAGGDAYGGGGASDIRKNGTGLADRVAVAAGGGGTAKSGFSSGAGGGLTGGDAGASGGSGATQTAGGTRGYGEQYGGNGALGTGGAGGVNTWSGGGGGGGYFGGGGGGACYYYHSPCGGGGGGSSWVSPIIGSAASTQSGVQSGAGTITVSWPVARDVTQSFGNDSYGELVNNVHLGSGNLTMTITDVEVATIGPDLEVSRSYNSLDSKVGWFGIGWSSSYEQSASADPVTGDVTIIYPDGRREKHLKNPGGSFTGPAGFVASLTAKAGGGWELAHKDRTVTTFDASGRLVGSTDRYGRSLTFSYSGSQLASVTDALSGRALSFTWSAGKVETVSTSSVAGPGYSGPLTWRYVYSGDLLTKVCDATDNDPVTGSCTLYGYTAGRLASVTRPEGNAALAVAYLADGKVDWTENGVGDRVTYGYWDGVSAVTDARGYLSYYFFDPQFRTTMMIDPAGGITQYLYDGNGFRSKVIDPNGNAVSMGYDARGNLASQTDGDGATSWSAYDASDNPTARRDARSSSSTDDTYKTSFTYNGFGDKLTETSPATSEQPSGVTQAWTFTGGGEDLGFGAVPTGLLRSSSDGVGTTWYAYDPDGDLRATTDPSGLVHDYAHDGLGRLTTETTTWAGGQSATTSTAYDQLGRAVTVTEPAVTSTVTGSSVTRQRQTTTDYDANGNPWRVTVSDVGGSASPTASRVTTTDFDDADRAWRTTDPEGGISVKTYDANGNVATSSDALGRTYRTDYDERNRPVAVTLLGFVDDPISGSTPRDLVMSRTDYDPAGRVTARYAPRPGTGGRAGQLSPSGTPMAKQRIAYDRADRPLTVTFEGYTDRNGTVRDIVLSAKTYDPAGNVLTDTAAGGRVVTNVYDQAGRLQTSTLEMGADDRVTEADYNQVGQTTRQRVTRAGSFVEARSEYDSAGRLVSETVENGADDLLTTHGYDQRGLRLWTVSPRGNAAGATPADYRTDFAYDLTGRLIETQAPAVTVEEAGGGPVTARPTSRLAYDAVGNQTVAVDPRGALTARSYDRLDRLTRIDHPAYTPPGGSLLTPYETFTFDAVGNMTARRDRRGETTDFTFDALNRAVRQLDPLLTGAAERGATITHYDDTGAKVAVTDPTGAVVEQAADDLGRLRTSTQVVRQATPTASYTTTFDYDDAGNQTYQQDPAGVVTTSAYDQAGQFLSVTDALGKQTLYAYDAAGRRVSETDPLGRRAEHVFDQAGRETSTVAKQPGTGTVLATEHRGFDPDGNQTEHRSARSASASDTTYLTSYTFDPAGRLVSVSQPGGAGTTGYGYDAVGNVTRVTDGNGNITTSTWTPWNTPESTVEPSTPGQTALADRIFSVTPDAAGLPVAENQPGVSVARAFDQLGRLTGETGTGTGIPTASRAFGYDLAGRRTSISHPDGTITLEYDDRGLLVTASQPGSATTESAYTWDAAGRMTSRADAAGTTTFTYTGRGELDVASDPITGAATNFDWNDAGQPAAAIYATSPTPAVRTYTYDGRGRLDSDTLRSGATVLAGAVYGLDAEGNLTSQAITASGNSGAGTHTYTYDPAGRLDSWTDPASTVTDYDYDQAGNRTRAGSHTAVYDARNRLLDDGTETYTWAPRGTLASTTAGGTTTPVTFDALGRQTAVGTVDYTHDALDRITDRDGVAFSYAGTEIDPAAAGGEAYARTPAGDLLAIHAGPSDAFAGQNRHGDLAWLLAGNGTVTDSRIWDPYGQPAGTAGTTTTALGYQSDYTDPTTGDVWMGARWYQPNTATFTARDTVFGMLRTPVSLNRYTYAQGDPLEYFDPDGRWSIKDAARSAVKGVKQGFETAAGLVDEAIDQTAGRVITAVDDHVVKPTGRAATATAQAVKSVGATAKRALNAGARKLNRTARNAALSAAVVVTVGGKAAVGAAKAGGRRAVDAGEKIVQSVIGSGSRTKTQDDDDDRDMSIWFGQRRIDPKFSDRAGTNPLVRQRPVEDVAEMLVRGEIRPEQLPLRVFKTQKALVALDNRTAAAYALAYDRAGILPVLAFDKPSRVELERLTDGNYWGGPLPSPIVAITPSRSDDTLLATITSRMSVPG